MPETYWLNASVMLPKFFADNGIPFDEESLVKPTLGGYRHGSRESAHREARTTNGPGWARPAYCVKVTTKVRR